LKLIAVKLEGPVDGQVELLSDWQLLRPEPLTSIV
jgi:hypothetical protein